MNAPRRSLPSLTLSALLLSAVAVVGQERASAEQLVARLGDAATRAEARAALLRHGAAAVPTLLDVVEDPDAELAQVAAALDTIARMGPDAVTAVPTLREVSIKLPGPAQSELWRALVRVWPHDEGFWSLTDADLLQAVMPTIQLGQRELGRAGVMRHWGTLQRINKKRLDPRAPEPLIAALRPAAVGDPIQEYVVDALRRLGPKAAVAAPKLRSLIMFPVPRGPVAEGEPRYLPIVETLLAVAPDAPEAAAAHAYLVVYHGDPDRRRLAAMAFGQQGEPARRLVPQVLAALDDPEPRVARELVTSLGMLGPVAVDAVPRLEKLVEHDDAQIAARAVAALRQIRRR